MEKQAMITQFAPYLFWDADPADLDIDKESTLVLLKQLMLAGMK